MIKVSVVICTNNSQDTIASTIESILKQTYQLIEIIVIDNNSNDKTIEIIKTYNIKNIQIFIDSDKGIFDAINKGIIKSSGEIISILHSDDVYYDEEVLSLVTSNFFHKKNNIVYGDLMYVKRDNLDKNIRYWKSSEYKKNLFYIGWSPPHPSFFVRRDCYLKNGLYKHEIGNAADIELMYRYLEINNIDSHYLNKMLIKMRIGGESNKSIINIFKQNLTIVNFLGIKKNPIKILIFIIFKILNRLKQFIKV
tara:strand:- start:394 stop:1149 length:756 start_codon:yes stop_codon:yes gene_type:complete